MTTSLSHTVPAPKHVKDVLGELLGRDVTVAETVPIQVKDVARTVVATYIGSGMVLGGAIGLDFCLAAHAGAALGLIPKGGAEACLEDKALSPAIAENVQEICNILASILNREGAPRLRMARTYVPPEEPPSDVVACLLAIGRRIDLTVTIAGYGGGRISVCLMPG